MSSPDVPIFRDPAFIEKIESKINKIENGCWEWIGKKRCGYGILYHNGKSYATHRARFEIHHDRHIVPGKFILHACDNEACCNPDHLREGSCQENTQDTRDRNRFSTKQPDRSIKRDVSRAFIVYSDPTCFLLIDEIDKVTRKIVRNTDDPLPTGNYTLEDGSIVCIIGNITNSKLFSSCREYIYDQGRRLNKYSAEKTNK